MQLFKRVSFLERSLFTKHLAVMVRAGITLPRAVASLRHQHEGTYFGEVLEEVKDDLLNGESLTVSLKRFPKVFDRLYVSVIEIAEEAGTLDDSLDFLAAQQARIYELRQKVRGAMWYPALVLSAALGVGGLMGWFVLPQIARFYEGLPVELPLATRILVYGGNFLATHSLGVALFILGFVLVIWASFLAPSVKPFWDRVLLRVPLLGKIMRVTLLGTWSRNLGVLLASGIPAVKALEITRLATDNSRFAKDLVYLEEQLKSGKRLGESMSDTNVVMFPDLVVTMVSVGEETGTLDESLMYLANFFEEDVELMAKNITQVIEPVLLLGVGVLVAIVALAVISPIYQITSSLGL